MHDEIGNDVSSGPYKDPLRNAFSVFATTLFRGFSLMFVLCPEGNE